MADDSGQEREDAQDAEPQGMGFTEVEGHALAWRLMARLATDWSAHLDWEDVPELGEYAWENLGEHLDEVALTIMQWSQNYDRGFNVDSADLLSRAQDGRHIGRDGRQS